MAGSSTTSSQPRQPARSAIATVSDSGLLERVDGFYGELAIATSGGTPSP